MFGNFWSKLWNSFTNWNKPPKKDPSRNMLPRHDKPIRPKNPKNQDCNMAVHRRSGFRR